MRREATSIPVRPQLFTEQIVPENNAIQEGGVQDEINEIDELRARVDELAKQQEVTDTVDVPMIRNPDGPTQEEVDKHELTHANFKPWCAHCQAALARGATETMHFNKNWCWGIDARPRPP